MALVSMKTDSDNGQEAKGSNPYGYGLQLCLDDDQCQALGINGAIPAGAKVMLNAMAFVSDSTQRLDDDADESAGVEYSLCLQITHLELSPVGTSEKSLAKLYPTYSSGTDKA